ncbi:carbohydrate ABC transporter permease [Acrocarpospora phusangensis]|uniref:carbohydrate ABC transporter permease n=1 Tax=Acrocarpospora phusangensis TaxID=1070424 RepID=UPI00194DF15A|nr:sugar ABC transporter permease [Acrocarpospora phusangensis]
MKTRRAGVRSGARSEAVAGWLFITPAVAHTLVFMAAPAVGALLLSFSQWDMTSAPTWAGLDNYRAVLFDRDLYPDFLVAVRVTAYYALLAVPASLLTGFVQAYLIDAVRRGQGVFRLAFYLPMITAEAAVAAIWKWLYDPQFGLINGLLGVFGAEGPDWLGEPAMVVPALALIAAWQSGTAMIIFLAGLKGIPRNLYEAAEVDGARRRDQLLRITIPLLRPTTFYLVITGVIGALQVFGLVYVLFGRDIGGPESAGLTYVLQLYVTGFRDGEMGAASAMSFLLFAVTIMVTALQFRLLRREPA